MEYNFNGVSIPFDEKWNRIAVSLSGGADSALLTYILCTLIKEKNPKMKLHVISHIRCWKTKPWQQYDSQRVYNYLQNMFNFIDWQRHVNFIAPELEYGSKGPVLTDEYQKQVSGDNIQIRAFSEYVCHYNKIDAYYNGVTKNPNVKIDGAMNERNIEPNKDNMHLRFIKHMETYAIHPFRFVTKDWIMKQYQQFKLQELLQITRSCEGEFSNITYKNYKSGDHVPVCGTCFWCQERSWALNEILQS